MLKLLRESGVEFDRIDYSVDPIPKKKLKELIAKMGLAPRDLLRTKEAAYRTLGLDRDGVSDARIIDAMVQHPELIQRPIVEKGRRAVLARPVERVETLM